MFPDVDEWAGERDEYGASIADLDFKPEDGGGTGAGVPLLCAAAGRIGAVGDAAARSTSPQSLRSLSGARAVATICAGRDKVQSHAFCVNQPKGGWITREVLLPKSSRNSKLT